MYRIVCLLMIGFCQSLIAQWVYFPVESEQAYKVYKSQWDGFSNNPYDAAQNRFVRLGPNSNAKSFEIEVLAQKRSKYFYHQPDQFYYLTDSSNDWQMVVNPVFHFSGGKQANQTIYRNTRGAEIYGQIGGEKGVGFYSLFTENQERYPDAYLFAKDSMNYVPNEWFYKNYQKQGAVDFFQARAYVTFSTAKNYIKMQFGHDKHKIGNGYRSLILSDFAPQYLFFKVNTDVKRFHYQNLFTQFIDRGMVQGNTLYPKKFGAFHRLSYDIRRNLQIGVNEMILFDRSDSSMRSQFDLNYLNPVIFYRAIESSMGSKDNSLMALDAQWTIRNRYQVFGQLLIDEFKLDYIKNQPNWWANKYAYQIGARAFNFAKIKDLDVLLEYNRVRPYTYSHGTPSQSYSHFNQPLAHPLGSNFAETVAQLKYQFKRWGIQWTATYAKMGRDSFLNGRNYGANILRSYDDKRVSDFSSTMYMGKLTKLMVNDVVISYQPTQHVSFDFRVNSRQNNGVQTLWYTFGLRINTALRQFNY